MIAVFAIFATLSLLIFKELGVGLAVAVLIDATIIRGVLLPSIDEAARGLELVPAEMARVVAAGRARARHAADVRRARRLRAGPEAAAGSDIASSRAPGPA